MNGGHEAEKQEGRSKTIRILSLYDSLNKGDIVNKQKAAMKFSVSEKAIQRDIDDLRAYLSDRILHEESCKATINYDRAQKGYSLSRHGAWLTQEEVLALAKVLLESRAFSASELNLLLDKVIAQCLPDTRSHITRVIRNERFHYLPVAHGQPLLHKIWDVSLAIREQRVLKITYLKPGASTPIPRELEPYGLIFAEYYFYLIAYIKEFGAEVFGGDVIKMWLLSQAEFLEVLKPVEFRKEMSETVRRMLRNYE